jgi:DNA modification methylase
VSAPEEARRRAARVTPYIQDADLTIWVGDALDTLRQLPDGSVDCCVTSPPYWGLRDYGTEGQLGLEPTPDEYVANMVEVFREVKRVLADHGTCWVNLGDSYAGTANGRSRFGQGGGDKTIVRPGYEEQNESGSVDRPLPAGLKQKDLCGVPWRVAFALQADGWYLRSDIIWSKPNPMPESVTDRPTKAHEFVFLLTKAPWNGREPGPIEQRLSKEDARWAALLVDAEGNICVKRVAPVGDKSPQYGAQIAVGSTSRALLERLSEIVGAGNVNERAGTNAPMFYWQVSNKVAQDFLYAIYPHLIVKRRQTAIAIYLESLLFHRGHPKGRTVNENAVLESLWARNKECNQFGDPDLSDVPAPKYGRWGASRYWFDQEAVREQLRSNSLQRTLHGRDGTGNGFGDSSRSMRHAIGTTNSAGRNVRSVWEIATQPYPEAHFATFPTELARRCIVAGCPEWVCRVCGKPRERLVKRGESTWDERKANGAPMRYGYSQAESAHVGRADTETVGWSDCGHNDYRQGVVLDPFIGSGTTAQVARRVGRHAVGIELSPEYAELAARRLQQLSLLAEEAPHAA